MSGMDVLRERIARALWEESGGTREWAKLPDDVKKGSGAYDMADAVIAALGLIPDVTPWERIEEDGHGA